MQNLLVWACATTAFLCATNAIPLQRNEVLPSGGLKEDIYHWDAFKTIGAVYYKIQNGAVPLYNTAINGTYYDNQFVQIFTYQNSCLVYSVDFGTEETATSIELGLGAGYPPGHAAEVNVYVDSMDSSPIATVFLSGTGYDYCFYNFTADVIVTSAPHGIHDVYFTFIDLNTSIPFCMFSWFQFKSESAQS